MVHLDHHDILVEFLTWFCFRNDHLDPSLSIGQVVDSFITEKREGEARLSANRKVRVLGIHNEGHDDNG